MQLVTTNVSEKVHLEEYFHLDKPVVLKSGYKPQMNFFFSFFFLFLRVVVSVPSRYRQSWFYNQLSDLEIRDSYESFCMFTGMPFL